MPFILPGLTYLEVIFTQSCSFFIKSISLACCQCLVYEVLVRPSSTLILYVTASTKSRCACFNNMKSVYLLHNIMYMQCHYGRPFHKITLLYQTNSICLVLFNSQFTISYIKQIFYLKIIIVSKRNHYHHIHISCLIKIQKCCSNIHPKITKINPDKNFGRSQKLGEPKSRQHSNNTSLTLPLFVANPVAY